MTIAILWCCQNAHRAGLKERHMFPVLLLLPLLVASPSSGSDLAIRNAEARAVRCSQQDPAAQEALIREAVEKELHVRRVEFLGNERTSDYVLRRRISLQEGDVFTRENLAKSLRSVSKLRTIIHPVKLSDVYLHLDQTEKIVDLSICFTEKRKTKKAAAE